MIDIGFFFYRKILILTMSHIFPIKQITMILLGYSKSTVTFFYSFLFIPFIYIYIQYIYIYIYITANSG